MRKFFVVLGVVIIITVVTTLFTTAINNSSFREDKEATISGLKNQVAWYQSREGIDAAEIAEFFRWVMKQSYLDGHQTGYALTRWGRIGWALQRDEDLATIYLSHPINPYCDIKYDIIRNEPWGILEVEDASINDIFRKLVREGVFKEVASTAPGFDHFEVNQK